MSVFNELYIPGRICLFEEQDLVPTSATRIELSKGRMAVAVRIRPLSAYEEEHSQRRVVSALDERQFVNILYTLIFS